MNIEWISEVIEIYVSETVVTAGTQSVPVTMPAIFITGVKLVDILT